MGDLVGHGLVAGYEGKRVLSGLDVRLASGQVTVLVGANGSGKSTLLRVLARLHVPTEGAVLLGGHDIARDSTRALARKLTFLPQSPLVPSGLTVHELVGHGRYAHRGVLGRTTGDDLEAVRWALAVTGLEPLAGRRVEELSGGERQRAWIAVVLAQKTGVLLLDEPTTFLDLRYQIEILALVRRLADEHGLTVGVVLHDLNQAAAFGDRIVMLSAGRVVASGEPHEVITAEAVRDAFGLEVSVATDPETGRPTCLPSLRGHLTTKE
ncbi:ABC transporter ATP-binding protein [Nonomuraea dietziae]|uniref:ABC transporter ATP-binding protein n=1 Tax=Nonomuraea dietziae TaxID=65515 RepID=UPI0033CAFBF2